MWLINKCRALQNCGNGLEAQSYHMKKLINAYWLNTGINIEKGKMLMTQTEDKHVMEICKGCFL